MISIQCWECGQPSGQHKLSCGSKSRAEALQWLLNSLHSVPDKTLESVIVFCEVELLERRLTWYEKEYVFIQEDNADEQSSTK